MGLAACLADCRHTMQVSAMSHSVFDGENSFCPGCNLYEQKVRLLMEMLVIITRGKIAFIFVIFLIRMYIANFEKYQEQHILYLVMQIAFGNMKKHDAL